MAGLGMGERKKPKDDDWSGFRLGLFKNGVTLTRIEKAQGKGDFTFEGQGYRRKGGMKDWFQLREIGH